MLRFKVAEDTASQRVDAFLAQASPDLSRSFIKKLCDDGKVKVNSSVVRGSQKLHASDEVTVDFDPVSLTKIPNIDLPIVYEDDDCLVINKPEGVLSHSKGAFNPEATVATFIEKHWKGEPSDRSGIVHRLDRGTSGLIICAKTEAALQHLQQQFNQRKVQKTYFAIVKGAVEPPEAIIDMPIARNPKSPKTFHASSLGKPALTHYKVVETHGNYSLVELKPATGRTHQIRVHLAHLKHPIVGDNFYHGELADRLYLHAESLELRLPNGKQQKFTAPLPKAFKTWMKQHAE